MLTFDVLTTILQLERVHEEWSDLFERCPAATPFQSPEWVVTWCRHFGCDSIWTPLARADGKLVGLSPWLIYTNKGQRTVAFLAGGVSDYHDVLIDPGFARAALAGFFELLRDHRAEWDECDFEQLGPFSLLGEEKAPEGFAESVSQEVGCPGLTLRPLPEPLSPPIPASQWERLAKYRRRAARRGPLGLSRMGHRGLELLFRLHERRWEEKGESVVLGDERTLDFHREVARRMGPERARVYCVELGSDTIAALYAFVQNDAIYCYMQGFDPAFGSLSPGLLLVGGVLEAAQREGLIRVDLLRGNEPYKAMWGGRSIPNRRRRMVLRSSYCMK